MICLAFVMMSVPWYFLDEIEDGLRSFLLKHRVEEVDIERVLMLIVFGNQFLLNRWEIRVMGLLAEGFVMVISFIHFLLESIAFLYPFCDLAIGYHWEFKIIVKIMKIIIYQRTICYMFFYSNDLLLRRNRLQDLECPSWCLWVLARCCGRLVNSSTSFSSSPLDASIESILLCRRPLTLIISSAHLWISFLQHRNQVS